MFLILLEISLYSPGKSNSIVGKFIAVFSSNNLDLNYFYFKK